MRTCAATADLSAWPAPFRARRAAGVRPVGSREAGFTLVEMLVAMVLLSLVGLALARFQTFQLSGSASLALVGAARLEADNLAVDILAARQAPTAGASGASSNLGRDWYWTVEPGPSPDSRNFPDIVRVDIAVALEPGGPPLATRTLLRPHGRQAAS